MKKDRNLRKKLKIFEEKDRVRIILDEDDLLEVSSPNHDPIIVKCETVNDTF